MQWREAWPAASPTPIPLLLPHPSSGQPAVVKNRDSDGVTLTSEYVVYIIAQEWSECEVSDAYQKGVIVIRLIAATAPLDCGGEERERERAHSISRINARTRRNRERERRVKSALSGLPNRWKVKRYATY